MTLPLDSIPMSCFQGVVPAIIATASPDGVPNVTYLSQVFRVDGSHVALSCQFFNKTKANVLTNPHATVELYDPVSFDAYRLELRYDHAETSGPLFATMDLRINAIASHTGMRGIFKLISADVYEVLSVESRQGFLDSDAEPPVEPEPAPPRSRSELRGIQLVSQRTCHAKDLDELMSAVLQTLDEAFGFEHSMMLMLDETGARLYAIATRGHEGEGLGAEIAIGEGLIGTVARERRVLRMSGVEEELRYGRAIRATVQRSKSRRDVRPEIPLPGLLDAQSHMAMPLVVGDRLLGVLAVESRAPLAFDEWDETYLEIVANQVAVTLDNMLLRERDAGADAVEPRSTAPTAGDVPRAAPSKRFRFFKNDDCVFSGDEYLVRNVPGRILWRILRDYKDGGRTEFTNRELRLDASLGLPPLRDNLESRLVLLRKRLAEKCPEIRLVSTERGRFRLEVDCRIELEERDLG
jgi:hypothetical protein